MIEAEVFAHTDGAVCVLMVLQWRGFLFAAVYL